MSIVPSEKLLVTRNTFNAFVPKDDDISTKALTSPNLLSNKGYVLQTFILQSRNNNLEETILGRPQGPKNKGLITE